MIISQIIAAFFLEMLAKSINDRVRHLTTADCKQFAKFKDFDVSFGLGNAAVTVFWLIVQKVLNGQSPAQPPAADEFRRVIILFT